MLCGTDAWHKSKDYYGNKLELVGKMVNNFSPGEFYPFYQWNIHKQKAAYLSSLLLFIQKQEGILEKKTFTFAHSYMIKYSLFDVFGIYIFDT